MDIGLTLSGGGFRATLFHLGVIQYLRKANLLPAVRHITAVSGGSIIAAHVAMNWDRYSGSDEQFKTVSQELIDFTQLGVREHIITWLPAIWVVRFLRKITFRKSTYNQSSLLSKMYAEYLFKKATNGTLKIHQTMPDVALASTNLSRPENLVTFSATGVTLHGPEGCEIKTQAISLAHAVTASSAFPLLFPAISIDNSMLGQSSGKLTPSPQYLSDGGIFDNYGIRALYEIRRGKPAFDLLIVSDAGARAEWEPNVSFGSISLLNRAAAITGQRVRIN
jgi:predicted acylesterase/phospholipase RssA